MENGILNEKARLLAVLKECSRTKDLNRGIAAHSQATASGLSSNRLVATSLINMYAKCGKMVDAHNVFGSNTDSLVHHVGTWTALINGYVKNGQEELALELFFRMELGGCMADARAYLAGISACASLGNSQPVNVDKWLECGKGLHSRAVSNKGSDIFVESALVDMYGKLNCMTLAREVFDKMLVKNVVCWNSLLLGYVENGQSQVALELFHQMESECIPDVRSYVAALRACGCLAAEEREFLAAGKAVHSMAVKSRCCDTFVENTLVEMYSKCGSTRDARAVFDKMVSKNVISWTAMLRGYVENEEYQMALELFMSMNGCVPDARVYIVVFQACACLAANRKLECLKIGKCVHSRALVEEDCNTYVENTLVDMYMKCGCIQQGQAAFDSMVRTDVVSWTALVLGYMENGESEIALDLVCRMNESGVTMNVTTFGVALTACGNISDLRKGLNLHMYICQCGVEHDTKVVCCLVDLYGKCGRIDMAKHVFDSIPQKISIQSWNALLYTYGMRGDTKYVFKLFQELIGECIHPDQATFVVILNACNHAGDLDRGKAYFDIMSDVYCINPTLIHYTCIIDLLGRAGYIHEALCMVRHMPFECDCVTWTTISGACQKWDNVLIGRLVREYFLRLGGKDSTYVLMNIYKR